MTEPFRTTHRVEFVETDMAGIAHFSNFFRWMESAEAEFLRSRGLTFKLPWEGQELGFPRVSAACDYLKPLYFEDVVQIALRVENVGRKSLTYTFEFTRNGEAIANGRVSCVCCRVLAENRLESIEIPASLRARLASAE